ncbi:histidine kinase [Acidovorax sp. SRB_14]|uniref:HDOD domain-containing protein n=1 Tax=Acidovorax sp. SRB_14 TaxID=1962699 RepID=UPI001469A2E6|nr:HDOD domain-containing protein [Acidovorax sp. SRB_14]NMM81460.1 histidine kinase [Acidovorax sp. SRB_14]NMM85393.1 histidine kinase [Rhodococcus sp. SRB_17]
MQSVLSQLVLGYRPLWGPTRTLAGVELSVHAADAALAVDAPHLLRTLHELWAAHSPPLLLAPQTRQLLCDLLAHAPPGSPAVAVPGAWLGDSAICQQVQAAHARGLQLVWRGDAGQPPEPPLARCFDTRLLGLSPETAVRALQAGAAAGTLLAGQMVEGLASRALVALCLDRGQAQAVLGWPQEDVLHSLRHQPLQPARATVQKLMKAIDAEQSLEVFEDILGEDPLLAYRFMVYTNSAALGLRTGIDSLRRGLVMMGYGSLSRWLSDQLPHASAEPDLQPVRAAMVVRARLTERLIDAGLETALRREVYLCALFSQLGELLREPLGSVLRRVPLSERIYDAAVLQTGPYAPSLAMARALEGGDAGVVRQLGKAHGLALEDVNRALLRTLASLEAAPPAP